FHRTAHLAREGGFELHLALLRAHRVEAEAHFVRPDPFQRESCLLHIVHLPFGSAKGVPSAFFGLSLLYRAGKNLSTFMAKKRGKPRRRALGTACGDIVRTSLR